MKASIYLKRYKIFLIILLTCFISFTIFAKKETQKILVFAGAGMRRPLDEIGEKVKKLYGIKVLYDYEGSGRLGNKILAGQTPDIFIPGSDKWAKILKEKDYVNDCTPLAFHTPVIITPKGNNKVTSLNDFSDSSNRLVLGDIKACAISGVSAAIFKKAGIKDSGMDVMARAVSVKQLVLWIEGNNADAAIVWKADAVQSGRVEIISIPVQYDITSIIPVCQIVKNKKNVDKYLHYLLGTEGKAIFKKHGFDVME